MKDLISRKLAGREFFIAIVIIIQYCSSAFAFGRQNEVSEVTNGTSSLRPFYIIGHDPDTFEEAKEFVRSGANGIEPDVNILSDDTNELCVGHGPLLWAGPANKNSPKLTNFLASLHDLARSNTNFCLVYFDCKSFAATTNLGVKLLTDIRTYLIGSNEDRVNLSVVISVASLKDKAIFSGIANSLNDREGLMVDEDSCPSEVSKYFQTLNVSNQCYCDGITPFNPFLSLFSIRSAVRRGCELRDQKHELRLVGTWTVNNPRLMKKYIKMGVDGILVDDSFIWYSFSWRNMGDGLKSLHEIVSNDGLRFGIRLANRTDNPFAIPEAVHSQ
jgi:hypothetical protein